MSVTVNAPRTPVTKGSMGIAQASIPNVCKMPGPPAPFVPTPLPNIGMSGNSPSGYSTSVTMGGDPVAIKGATFNSVGDIASQGTGGGVVSNNAQGPTSFVAPGSLDVTVEGKAVQLKGDQMLNNCAAGGSPANSATMMGTNQTPGGPAKPTSGIDCDKNSKPPEEGGKGWDDCDKKQLCAKVKELNEKQAAGKLVVTPGANDMPAYTTTKENYKEIFAIASTSKSPLTTQWEKDQFFHECAYDKWNETRDPTPSVKPDENTQEAFNPDHIQDAALGGSLTSLSNLRWLSASVNKSIGSSLKNYDPKSGPIVMNPNCGCK